MSYVLVKFEANWADEMDIAGFVVMSTDNWQSFKEHAAEYESYEMYIGSNQSIDFQDYAGFMRVFKEIELTEAEKDMYLRDFGKSYDPRLIVEYGHTSLITRDEFFGMD